MPVGIENLATGFLQGLNARKQQERQDVIDQREAERFDMQKQQFADNQAANQLSMKTNQFQLGQAQAKAEREKILQEKEDNFRKQWEGFARPFAMGNDQEGYNALERTYNDLGYMGKGAFKRDAQGNVLLDDKGNITFLTYGADGKPASKLLNKDKMIEGFINSYDPLKHWEHEQKTKAEIAKEDREFKRELRLSGIKHGQAKELELLKTRKQRELFELRGKLKDPKKYLSKPTQDSFYDVQEIIDPFTKQKSYSKPIFNQDRYDDFMLFSHANNLDPDDNAYRLWRKNRQAMPNGLTINQPSQTREGLITPKNLDGGGIDMSDFSLTPSGGGGNNMQNNTPSIIPVSRVMPVPQVIPTASYDVPTRRGGFVRYDENGNTTNYVSPTPTMPIDVVNAVRDAIPDMPPPRQFPPGTTYFNPPRRTSADTTFFSGDSNPFEEK